MKKQLLSFINPSNITAVLMLLMMVFAQSSMAQFTNSTVPPLSGGNGSGGSTFNFTVTAPILVTEIGQSFYGPSTSATYTIWMSNTPISGPPNISTANGWTMIQTGSVVGLSNGLTPVIVSIPLTSPMLLTPGTYGFYVGGSANVVYTTYSGGVSTFSDALTTIDNGPGVGYGGNVPSPTFSTRQFNGSVTYVPASSAPNNIALTSIVSPGTYCAGATDSISVNVANFGSNQIDSFMVVWDVNGSLDSSWFIAPLDTFSGSGSTDTTITLQILTMPAGTANISVWTKWPNGVQDTDTSNDTASNTYMPALSGIFTIDQSGTGDFISFTDAVSALNNFGVCGPTIIEVVDGTYVEQIEFQSIVGISSVNSVTFRSQSGDSAGVVLSYLASSSADNFVINFDNTSNLSFEDMTIQSLGTSYIRVLTTPTSGGTHDITFKGCMLKAPITSSTSTFRAVAYIYGAGNDNWIFTDNTIEGGSYGLYMYGSFATKQMGNEIMDNRFMNQYYQCTRFYYQENGKFNGNYATSNTSYNFGYGFYMGQLLLTEVKNNHIEGTSNWPNYGMYIITSTGDLNTFIPISGNRVIMPKPAASRGMYLSNCLFTEISHNSVMMSSTSNTSPAMYLTGGGYNKVLNNIFMNTGTGTAVYVNGNPIFEMDYNNFSAPNGVIGYAGTAYTTLADWQMGTGNDSNSLNVNTVISDTATFKVCTDSLYAMGVYLPSQMMDFEGDLRQDPPCIGADEFMSISEFGFDSDPVLCDGDTLILRQDYFDLVVWDTVDTSNVFVVTSSGSHSVAVYDACGSDTSQFSILSQDMPSLSDTNLCEGTSAVLNTGISNGTYMWSNGSTDSTVIVDSAQTLTVAIVDAFGCISSDTSVVTQSYNVELPAMDSFCTGLNTVLTANVTGSYLWSTGESTSFISVSTTGSYTVTVTDLNCESNSTTNVIEKLDAIPSFTDSSSYLTVSFTNTSQYADSYSWDFGDGTAASTDVHPIHVYPWTAEDLLLYNVVLTATNYCGSVDVINDEIRVGQLVSVSNIELTSMINVFPNPNNGTFNVVVKTDKAAEMKIEVVNVGGATIYSKAYGSVSGESNRSIHLEGASQGMYFVKVILDNETAVYRITVN